MKKHLSVTCILLAILLVAACAPVPAEEPMAAGEEAAPAAEAEEAAPPEAPMEIACENSYEGKAWSFTSRRV